jgi:fumarylacetoacetate (FAA) hydrolase
MKLATYKDGSRDGQLVVVSRDLSTAHFATGIATRMQQALDDWNFIAPLLQDLSVALNHGKTRHAFPFVAEQCMAPLPRAFQWADGSAYLNHVELVRKARGAEMPESFFGDPLMYQGGSDDFLGPCDPALFGDAAWGIDFEAEVAVITGDVAMRATPEQALEGVRLVLLANDWSLRNLIPAELGKGFGFLQSKPASALSPVFVTPDELGEAWAGGKLSGVLKVDLNGQPFGRADAGEDMTFDFGTLVAHLATTRNLGAGTIVGSGTVSNRDADGGPGKPVDRGGRGYSCLAEVRTVETILDGAAATRFLKAGDTVRIWMEDASGHSIFGAIEQEVVAA